MTDYILAEGLSKECMDGECFDCNLDDCLCPCHQKKEN